MPNISDQAYLREQYKNAANLNDRIQLHVRDRLAADVFQGERHCREQLVHAVLDAGIEPSSTHVDRFDKLCDWLARAGSAPRGGKTGQ